MTDAELIARLQDENDALRREINHVAFFHETPEEVLAAYRRGHDDALGLKGNQ